MAENLLGPTVLLVYIGVLVLIATSMWRLFTKSGRSGWAAIVPVYNLYVMFKIGNNPGWYLALLLVPVANIYAMAKLHIGIAKAFGKGIGWGIGLWFLPYVFMPLLAFGDYTYQGGTDGGAGGQPAV